VGPVSRSTGNLAHGCQAPLGCARRPGAKKPRRRTACRHRGSERLANRG
jgi:hypothetical protein